MTPEETPCPGCGEYGLTIELRLEALPLGTYSIAGAQLKIVCRAWPYLVCRACGISARAKEPDEP